MKHSLLSIFFLALFAIPCSAQWKDAKFGDRVLAFGVHDSSFFVGSVPYAPQDPIVFQYVPPNLWGGADNGLDRTQGLVTSFASLGKYFFAGMTQTSNGSNGPVYRSSDSGSNWETGGIGCPIYSNGRYLFGCSQTSVYRSRDTSRTWQAVPSSKATSFASIGIDIFANTGSAVWRSMDTGNHWSQIHPPFIGTLTPMDSLLFIVGNGQFAESADSGSDWNIVPVDSAGVPKQVQCMATDGKNLFVGTPTGILLSTDVGQSWQPENDGLTYPNIVIMGVFDTLLFADAKDAGQSGSELYLRSIPEMTAKSAVAATPNPSGTLSVYPNPLTNRATITYRVAEDSRASIEIYDALGRTVSIPVPGMEETAGDHELTFDARELPSGIYWCHLTVGSVERSVKLVIQH